MTERSLASRGFILEEGGAEKRPYSHEESMQLAYSFANGILKRKWTFVSYRGHQIESIELEPVDAYNCQLRVIEGLATSRPIERKKIKIILRPLTNSTRSTIAQTTVQVIKNSQDDTFNRFEL